VAVDSLSGQSQWAVAVDKIKNYSLISDQLSKIFRIIIMAIWQFYLEVVPREGIGKIHPNIPEKFELSTEDGFFDAKTEQYWEVSEFYPTKTIQKVDAIIKRTVWSNNSHSFNWEASPGIPDNDAFLTVDKNSKNINHFHFRSDLREENLNFLREMLDLSKEMDWLLMDRKGFVAEPEMKKIIERVKVSNAFRFLSNPKQFFDDLDNGKIELG
jgi:hypothetical protein